MKKLINAIKNYSGKYKGQRVVDVFRRDLGYYGWIQQGDFPQYTKNVFTRIYLSLRK